jgi:WD40 repeat protein
MSGFYALLQAAGTTAHAQPVRANPTDPYLMLDTGGHSSTVRALAFSKDGRTLYSGGDDKVVRVWDWPKGATQRVIRVPAGEDHYGRIYALALSPDEQWLAVAADNRPLCHDKTCANIRVYDAATGEFNRALTAGHDAPVLSLTFSSDGTRLLSSSIDDTAVLWNFESGTQLKTFSGHGESIYRAAFTTDGQRIVTGSEDRTLRLWDAQDGRMLAEMKGHKSGAFRVAVSSLGDVIASADHDGEIRLWDQKTGAFIKTLVTMANRIGGLAFDQTGRIVIAGTFNKGEIVEGPTAWRIEDGAKVSVYAPQKDAAVAVTRILPAGSIVATGDKGGEIHIWNFETGKTEKILKGSGGQVWSVDVSLDGHAIGWGRTWKVETPGSRGPITHSLGLPRGSWFWRTSLSLPTRIERFARHRGLATMTKGERGERLALSSRRGGEFNYKDVLLDLKEADKLVQTIERKPTNGYQHTSYGFAPGGQHILSGGDNGHLEKYQLDGTSAGEFVGHDGQVWSLAAHAGLGLLISGGGDQTVRIWNLETRELIATLFHGDNDEWVMWTPQGYYTGSPRGGRLVGWLVNAADTQAPKFYYADELPTLSRRDIVEKAIELKSAFAAIDAVAKRDPAVRRTFADWIKDKTGRQK